MNLLAIETSSPFLSVAVKRRGAKLRQAAVKGYMKHAENLLPVIDRLLKKEKLKIGDIDAFLIDRGPGSFTGLRIGFATMKGFLAIRPKPCYGAFSMDIIAAGSPIPSSPSLQEKKAGSLKGFQNLTICLDAKRGKLYARSYRSREKRWIPSGLARVVLFEKMAQELPRGSWVAGDGIPKFDAKGFVMTPEGKWYPQASTLIELFEMKAPFLKKLARPKEFLPFYLRNSEAEERRQEIHKK